MAQFHYFGPPNSPETVELRHYRRAMIVIGIQLLIFLGALYIALADRFESDSQQSL